MQVEKPLPEYRRKILYQTDAFELVSIEWDHMSHSPEHSHHWSECLVLIQEGRFENILDLGYKLETQIFTAGQVMNTPLGARHQMRCLSAQGKTLHFYSPKIPDTAEANRFHHESLEKLRADLTLTYPSSLQSVEDILTSLRLAAVNVDSPFFVGPPFSGILPQTLLAEKTLQRTDKSSPVFSLMEAEVVECLGKIIGWPLGARDGLCLTGENAANFMAIETARQKKFPWLRQAGMAKKCLKVLASANAHPSLKQACASLGFGTDNYMQIPVNRSGQMDLPSLRRILQDCKDEALMVVATAGTNMLGAFDSIPELAELCRGLGIWLHVDATSGGPALFSSQLRPLVKGIELADSVSLDTHKFFGASFNCSFFLTRHLDLFYDFADEESNPSGNAISFWTLWKSLGTEGLGQFTDRLVEIRGQTIKWLSSQPRLQLITTPEFLNICVRVMAPANAPKPEDWSRKVSESLKKNNLASVSCFTNAEGSFLRLVLANPYLGFAHLQQILQWALEVPAENFS